jgi:hypothetical protein
MFILDAALRQVFGDVLLEEKHQHDGIACHRIERADERDLRGTSIAKG